MTHFYPLCVSGNILFPSLSERGMGMAALEHWPSGCGEASVCVESQPQRGREPSPGPGSGQAVSRDTGSAVAAPGQGMQ